MLHHLVAIRDIVIGWVGAACRRPLNGALALCMIGALVWVYGAVVYGVMRAAISEPLWYHCLAVPLASGWIWYRKRHEIAAAPVKPWWAGGVLLLALAALFRLGEIGEGGGLLGGVSLILGIAAMVALLGGRERLRRSAFAVIFLAFGVPVPRAVFGLFAFPMQQMSAALTTAACRIMGLPVVREGVVLTLGDFTATIADACSGLNSLFALLMCGMWIVGLARVAWYHRAWMLLAIGPIVMFGNVLRLSIMMVVALFFGGKAALGFFHKGSDLVLFLILASFLAAIKMHVEGTRLPATLGRLQPVTWTWETEQRA